MMALATGLSLAVGWTGRSACAQQPQPPPAAQHPAAAPPQQPTPSEWDGLPTMLLEKIYKGPLRDTIIQRWRDPIDGSVCFIYLPISVPLLPKQEGYVQYGAGQIGSVSCVHPTQVLQLWQAPPAAPDHPATRRP
jgi:hypothetical protein